MPKTNPNGANQYQLDPRQKLCWDYYVNPKSPTWSNAYKSAVKAGYDKTTAKSITTFQWFVEKTRRMNLLGKAEKVLDEMLELPVKTIEYSFSKSRDDEDEESDEEVRESYLVTEPALVKIKQDTAKFLAERLGKDEGYSSRSEITGKNGENLIPDEESKKKADEAIRELLYGKNTADSK